MNIPENRTLWHKSSYSANTDNCVEVRHAGEAAQVRDTKHPAAGTLAFAAASWSTFLAGVRPRRH